MCSYVQDIKYYIQNLKFIILRHFSEGQPTFSSSPYSTTLRLRMDGFAKKVRTFDAFPKVDEQHTVSSLRGGLSTILTWLCGLLILWVEVGGYLGGYVDHQFSVDDEVRSDTAINIDILVAMPCEFIHTNVQDITKDRYLAGETLNFVGMSFFTPEHFRINNPNDQHETPDLDEVMQESLKAMFAIAGERVDEKAPACHIFGSIPVNQVKGDFHITAKGYGYRDRLHVPFEALNFSHVIQELSFGEFYPMIRNPLDNSGKVVDDKLVAFKYYAKVVPTKYERLGVVVDTNQFSLTENILTFERSANGRPSGIPGIYFKYDFEPIKLSIKENRLSFWQFVSRLATIIGGLLVLAGYLYRLYERLLMILFAKKYVEKDTEKKTGGILDNEIKPKHDKDY